MPSLSEVYLAHRPDAGELAGLEACLERACASARAALEGVSHDDAALAAGLAGLPRAIDAIDGDAVIELALALACARGDDTAIRLLEREYFDGVRGALRAMKLDADLTDEVIQEVRRKLLVGEPPKIVGYAGRGSLRGLLKVTATRTAISLLRKGRA